MRLMHQLVMNKGFGDLFPIEVTKDPVQSFLKICGCDENGDQKEQKNVSSTLLLTNTSPTVSIYLK